MTSRDRETSELCDEIKLGLQVEHVEPAVALLEKELDPRTVSEPKN
jgi:hypothetical protein